MLVYGKYEFVNAGRGCNMRLYGIGVLMTAL